MSVFIVIPICALLALTEAGSAAGPHAAEGFPAFRESVVRMMDESGVSWTSVCKNAALLKLTHEEAILEITSMAERFRRESDRTSDGSFDDYQNIPAQRCVALIACVADHIDKPAKLKLLEEMVVASNALIRADGQLRYIRVAGVDGAPFLLNLLANTVVSELEHYTIYQEFGRQVERAQEIGDTNKFRKGAAFLLDATQKEKMGNAAKGLDEVLCRLVPEFETSEQRSRFAERFSREGNAHYKRHFGNIKVEIDKTPPEKRKDFRAKGELLDPEHSKRSEPDRTR